MKSFLVRLALAGLLVTFWGMAVAHGATAPMGLQVALTTGGNRFDFSSVAAVPVVRGHTRSAATPAASFPATVSLTNLGREAVTFTFPSAAAALTHFRFRIFDATGSQIWESVAEPDEAESSVVAALPRRAAWRQTVQVPLKVNGQWLPVGRYTLEAMVMGDAHVGASTIFEVIGSVDRTDTGIEGKVTLFDALPGTSLPAATLPHGSTNAPPPAPGGGSIGQIMLQGGYYVRVSEVASAVPAGRVLFSWEGYVGAQGEFSIQTPPGVFQVVVVPERSAVLEISSLLLGSGPQRNGKIPPVPVTVTVPLGQYVQQNVSVHGPDPSRLQYQPVNTVTEAHGTVYSVASLGPDVTFNSGFVYSPDSGRHLALTATGTVDASRARYAKLVMRGTGMTADGYMEFDLVATDPLGPEQVVPSVQAVTRFKIEPGYKGSRVYSESNTVTSLDGATY